MRAKILVVLIGVVSLFVPNTFGGTNNLPLETGAVIKRNHINKFATALQQNHVPRNAAGVPTDSAGGLGTSALNWGPLNFLESITIGDPDDDIDIDSVSADLVIRTADIQALRIGSDQVVLFDQNELVGIDGNDRNLHSDADFRIIIDSNNDQSNAVFSIMKDGTLAGSATAVMTVGEDSVIEMNDGNPTLSTNGAFVFRGDFNGTTTSAAVFAFRSNPTNETLMLINESTGSSGVSVGIGNVGPVSTNVFRVCMSADCSALFQIRNEFEPSMLALQFNDGTAVNGFFIENENTSANENLDMFDVRINMVNAGGRDFMEFQDNSGVVGRITGVNPTTISYQTTSDARLKQNEIPLPNALDTLLDMQPYEFEWVKDPSIKAHGFYAQELKDVYHHPVTGDPERDEHEDPMGIDYAKLTPILVAGIQELYREVETLKKEVVALKGSALVSEFERKPEIAVNNYSAPSYTIDTGKDLSCTSFADCRKQFEQVRGSHCAATYSLHRKDMGGGQFKLECRKVSGYTQKNIQKWGRR